jgi:hypothetical protein
MAASESADARVLRAAVFTVRPSQVRQNCGQLQRLFVTFASAAWDGSTLFTLSGVDGVTKAGQIVTSATQAYVLITTTAVPVGTPAQALTVSDGTNSGTTSVCPTAPTRRRYFA